MKLYITPAGKTALYIDNFLDRAKEEFGFDVAIILTDASKTNILYDKFCQDNVIIVAISDPCFGVSDYLPTIKRIVQTVLVFCPEAEEIIVNSSGGTEKMTSIVKDASDILGTIYPIKRAWGIYDVVTKDVVFVMKPAIDPNREMENIMQELDNEGEQND